MITVKDQAQLSAACKAVFDALRKEGVSEEGAFDGKLIAAELMTNAFKHTKGGVTLKIEPAVGGVELTAYYDEGCSPPEKAVCSDVFDEGGRGLFLVDALSVQRTRTPDGGIKVLIKL